MAKKKHQKQALPKPNPKQQTSFGELGHEVAQWFGKQFRRLGRWVTDFAGKPGGSPVDSTGAMTMPPPAGGDTAFRFTGILLLAVGLLIVTFGSILGTRLYSVMGMGQNRIKNIPVVYLQGRDTLKFKSPLLDETVTITEGLTFDGGYYSLEENTAISENGKQLLYLNNISGGSGELFLRNTNRVKPRNKDGNPAGQLVAEEVLQGSFRFTPQEAVMYMRAEQTGGNTLLYWQDGKEQVLDIRVHRLLGTGSDGSLYYTTRRTDIASGGAPTGEYNLCRIGTDGVVQIVAEKLDGQVAMVDETTGSVLFSTPAGRSKLGDMLFTLNYWNGNETQVLVENVNSVADYGGSNLVFSTGISTALSNPFQYFEDDMAEKDAAIEEPQEADFMVETVNLWGTKKTALDKKAFDAAVIAYEEKLERDQIRAAIAAQERNIKQHTLYYNAGSSMTMVDDGILQMADADASIGVAVYVKERIAAPQKFKISQVSDPIDAIRLLNTILISTVRDYYYVNAGREPELFLSATRNERVRVRLDRGKGIYYIKEDSGENGSQLNYVSVQEDGLGVAKKVDDKVVSLTNLRYH
ncbi:MAG: hypothetical protein RSF82_09550, partial [Angelakisella sp.]